MRQLKSQSNNNILLNITIYRHEIIIKIKKKRITMLIVKWESAVLEIIEAAKILDCVKHIHL